MLKPTITELDAVAVILGTHEEEDIEGYVTAEQYAEHKGISISGAHLALRIAFNKGKLTRKKARTNEGDLRFHYKPL